MRENRCQCIDRAHLPPVAQVRVEVREQHSEACLAQAKSQSRGTLKIEIGSTHTLQAAFHLPCLQTSNSLPNSAHADDTTKVRVSSLARSRNATQRKLPSHRADVGGIGGVVVGSERSLARTIALSRARLVRRVDFLSLFLLFLHRAAQVKLDCRRRSRRVPKTKPCFRVL